MNNNKYYYEIDILRGIACLLVFFYHFPIYRVLGSDALNLCSGLAGVYAFFIISGFIITKTFGQQLIKIDNFDLDNWYNAFIQNREQIFLFWYRRFLRLFPAMFLLFCCAFILTLKFGIENNEILKAIVTFFRFILTLMLLGDPFENSIASGINHFVERSIGVTWSLTYEILFYLIFPCIIIFKNFLRILLAFLAISFITRYQHLLCYSAFSIGVLLGVYHDRIKINMLLLNVLTIANLCALIIGDANGGYQHRYLFSSAFLIYVAAMQKNILNFPVIGAVLNFIGIRSYFIYLMHNIINIIITTIFSVEHFACLYNYIPKLKILVLKDSLTIIHIKHILILIVTILLADLFYRFVERPFIEKNRHRASFN